MVGTKLVIYPSNLDLNAASSPHDFAIMAGETVS